MTTPTASSQARTLTCPKCGHPTDDGARECVKCHVILDKARRAEAETARTREDESSGWMGQLAAADGLSVKQNVERLEAWTGFETANSYVVKDGMGNAVLHANEESGSVAAVFVRNYLKAARPFTLRVETMHGDLAMTVHRPFRWFFYEVEVRDAAGRSIGRVERQFSVFSSEYKLTGRNPTESYRIHGPFFRPWTFKIMKGGQQCGLISKRWGGLGREMFTDADAFGVEFPPGISAGLKAAFLGAVFLIDFAHFENNNR